VNLSASLTLQESLTCRKILHVSAVLISLRRKPLLRTFIALKNLSPSAGFEPANVGSNDKKGNH
jgi:hypothetical protein